MLTSLAWRRARRGAGVRVLGIAPGSVAAAIGLEHGDELIAINGKPIIDDRGPWWEVFVRVGDALETNELDFEILRRGQRVELELHVDASAR